MISNQAGHRHARGFALALAASLLIVAGCGSSPAKGGPTGSASSSAGAGGASNTGGAGSGSTGGASGTGGETSTGGAGSSGTSSTTSASGTSGTGGSGTVACGCNGMAGCAVWKNVYVTWYGYNDNSCGAENQHGCNDIANPGLGPQMHMGATAGKGTYDDPSTAAVSDTSDPGHVFETSGGATLKPGTLIYNPEVQQYFIFEDSCLECGDEYSCHLSSNDTDDPVPPSGCQVGKNLHIDFWMGPNDKAQPNSLQTCEDNATIGMPYGGAGVIIVNPPPNLPVKLGLLYVGDSSADGGCFTSSQVNGDSCP